MANNRLRLRCTTCGSLFPVIKYYPSTGWYINRGLVGVLRFGPSLNRWLDDHRHAKTLFGTEIVTEYEVPPDAPPD